MGRTEKERERTRGGLLPWEVVGELDDLDDLVHSVSLVDLEDVVPPKRTLKIEGGSLPVIQHP